MMPMEGMATAMTMSFLLPGIGLGLLKGMLLAELFRDRPSRGYGHRDNYQPSYGYQRPQDHYGRDYQF